MGDRRQLDAELRQAASSRHDSLPPDIDAPVVALLTEGGPDV